MNDDSHWNTSFPLGKSFVEDLEITASLYIQQFYENKV